MNPLFQQRTLNNASRFGEMMRTFNSFSNPLQAFLNMAGNNPQMQPIINQIRQGVNPEALFNELCKQRGVNPNEFIKKLTNK